MSFLFLFMNTSNETNKIQPLNKYSFDIELSIKKIVAVGSKPDLSFSVGEVSTILKVSLSFAHHSRFIFNHIYKRPRMGLIFHSPQCKLGEIIR